MAKQPSINLTETGNLLKGSQTNLIIPCTQCFFRDICKYKENIGHVSASKNFIIHIECKEQRRLLNTLNAVKN